MRITLTQLAGCIIIGTLPLTVLQRIPAYKYDIVVIVIILVLLLTRKRLAVLLGITLLVMLFATGAARSMLNQIEQFTSGPIQVEVKIDNVYPDGRRARVRLLSQRDRVIFPPIYAAIQLPATAIEICAGQRWNMHLTLRPVHAPLNEGGFDRQRFALANSIPLTGKATAAHLLSAQCSMRARIMASSQARYHHLPWQGLISALAFGERSEVDRGVTRLLRETGTAHLMAIAGMQIGLAASFGWLAARLLQYVFPARRIGYRFPLFVSLLVALIYCWLSGANPPAMRAILALTTWSLLRLNNMNGSSFQVWLLCIALILVIEPLSILSDSLWLSALAVAGLLIWYHSFPLPAAFKRGRRWLPLRLLHLQLGMLLLLMPMQVFIFHGFSLSALAANLWAVPLISLVTVPLVLIALLCNAIPIAGPLLWLLVDRSLALVFMPLQLLPRGWLSLDESQASASLLCWLLLLSLRFNWWRSSPVSLLSVILLLCSWRGQSSQPDWRVDMLDVGHGLAVAVSRHGKALLYDTGSRWPGGDYAQSQILPWLTWHGLQVTDIVISHGHLDHIGGLESIQAEYPQASVRSALNRSGHLPCRKGVRWQWQGLAFEALWPPAEARGEGNNQSCVVTITDGRWRVLLTGDIEMPAELRLVQDDRQRLGVDLLQVPHHGSRTSSSPPLLRATRATAAIASAARFSAWRLPAKQIIKRYEDNHIQWRDTALSGQLSARFFADNWQLVGLREQIMNRWYHQWFGVPRDSR